MTAAHRHATTSWNQEDNVTADVTVTLPGAKPEKAPGIKAGVKTQITSRLRIRKQILQEAHWLFWLNPNYMWFFDAVIRPAELKILKREISKVKASKKKKAFMH